MGSTDLTLAIWFTGTIIFFIWMGLHLAHMNHHESWREMASQKVQFIRLFILSAMWPFTLLTMALLMASPKLMRWVETGEWRD